MGGMYSGSTDISCPQTGMWVWDQITQKLRGSSPSSRSEPLLQREQYLEALTNSALFVLFLVLLRDRCQMVRSLRVQNAATTPSSGSAKIAKAYWWVWKTCTLMAERSDAQSAKSQGGLSGSSTLDVRRWHSLEVEGPAYWM